MSNWQDFLQYIIAPQLSFEAARDDEKFCRLFANLYRIETYKDGLDLILSKLSRQEIGFEIKIIRNWDTNQGCYLRSENSVRSNFSNNFEKIRREKIILRSFNHNVLAHEMAHACEFSSEISLTEIFSQAISFDLKGRKAPNLAMAGEIKRLMIDDLRLYEPRYFLSELFARFFELLSLSKAINPYSAFSEAEIYDFFANSQKFISEIFNPKIREKIDPSIARITTEIAKELKISGAQYLIRDQIAATAGSKRGTSWANSVKKEQTNFPNPFDRLKIQDDFNQ